MTQDDQIALIQAIGKAITDLDDSNELVLCSDDPTNCATKIASSVRHVVPNTGLNSSEMLGIRSLILHAISDKRFFDWEMPILTGFSAEQFKAIADKLPRE
ncbi:hypothetical protein [Leisingera sp. ANG-M7]|uniref:hypothetical protein n=1 Tax=Leisingera sp. ANG-M7 TaxID=1577902 RepID=UPI00126A0171|nr:hypothetical protein [Leisingera sp. ANG-M7]